MEEQIIFWAVWVGDYRAEWVGVTKETDKTFHFRGNHWSPRYSGSKRKPLSFIRCKTEFMRDEAYEALNKMREDQDAERRALSERHTDECIALMAALGTKAAA